MSIWTNESASLYWMTDITCLVFFPDIPGSAVSRGDVVDPALTVGVQGNELLEPEDEHVGPQPAVDDGGVLRPGDLADIVSRG